MRFRGYIQAFMWLLVPFAPPVGTASRSPAAVSDTANTAASMGVLDSTWHGIDRKTPDSVLVKAGICDSAMTYCDFSIASYHPDSIRLGIWAASGRDTLSPEQRTQRFYDSLEARTSRSWFWRFVHDLVVSPRSHAAPSAQVIDEASVYGVYNGKRIAAIEFDRRPVFEPARSYLEKGANAVHVTTGLSAVKRDLLFKEGDVFNADAVVRYKQLLRSRQYIADADIVVVPVPGDPDAVILKVITRDSWSISADGSVRGLTGEVKGELYDANFLGTGDRLSYQLSLDWKKKKYEGSMFRYYVPNLFGSFYEANLTAGRSFSEKYYGANLNKKFIQPSDYEVGALFENVRRHMEIRYELPADTVRGTYMVHYNNLDLWGGKSWYLPHVESSAYAMGRINYLNYIDPPSLVYAEDPPRNPVQLPIGEGMNPYFYDRTLTLASLGFYKERFLTTSLIYGYGYDEYVATGYRAEVVVGHLGSIYRRGWYGGLALRAGGFSRLGYIMGDASVGTFYDFGRRRPFQSALNVRLDYFTDMLGRSRFKVRQFASVNYLNGWNRDKGFYESVWFTRESGPREMRNSPLGRDRLVFSAETVVFTPWQPLGFRMALYGFGDVGFLGYNKNVFRNDLFATVGVGIRMKNEMLVFGTIQLSLFVNFGRHGVMNNEWIQLTSERRMQTIRYIPSKPQVVAFQ